MADAAVTGGGSVTGIVLAAGAGSRMGTPKALLSSNGVPWLVTATALLEDGGCRPVLVVLGAEAERARALLPGSDVQHVAGGVPATELRPGSEGTWVVVAERWAEGLAHSLRAGLAAATGTAVVVTVVDMPGLPAGVLHRLLEQPVTAQTLRQAVFEGAPGHPVVIGRAHWAALSAELDGDTGARRYLAAHGVVEVECGDLFDGRDIDTPGELAAAAT
jgi:CTP:molybdopterin cytidylyltransferase MocA